MKAAYLGNRDLKKVRTSKEAKHELVHLYVLGLTSISSIGGKSYFDFHWWSFEESMSIFYEA